MNMNRGECRRLAGVTIFILIAFFFVSTMLEAEEQPNDNGGITPQASDEGAIAGAEADGPDDILDARYEVALVCAFGHGKDMLAPTKKDELAARSGGPSSLMIDKKGHIYILDLFNLRVSHFDEKGKQVETVKVPACETEDVEDLEYFSDMIVTDERLIFLNNTSRRLLFFDRRGKFHKAVALENLLKDRPLMMALTPKNWISIRDESDGGVIVGMDGSVKGRATGFLVSEYMSPKGFQWALANDTRDSIDLVGVKPVPPKAASGKGSRYSAEAKGIIADGKNAPRGNTDGAKPEFVARLKRALPMFPLQTWKILGTDAQNNVYVCSIERIAVETGEVQVTINRVSADGKLLARAKLRPEPSMHYFPERQYVVSPTGEIYFLGANTQKVEFRLFRYKF
jgi:hypothetical protein